MGKRTKSVVIVYLVLCLTAGISGAVAADSGQTVDTIDKERFAYVRALDGLQRINEWLKSFKTLTALTTDRITPEEKGQVGNTGFEMQSLAFYNLPRIVEGTLRRQNYEISKLEYELALERRAAGKVSQMDVDAKKESFQAARNQLQTFLDKFRVAD